MTVIGYGFKFMILIWLFSFLLFQHSSLREIICLVVSSWEHVFKAFERIQCTHGNDYDAISTITLNVWRALSAADAREADPIPGWGKSPGGGNGNPLQYSYLGNPMDRGARQATVHGVTKSQTQPSD